MKTLHVFTFDSNAEFSGPNFSEQELEKELATSESLFIAGLILNLLFFFFFFFFSFLRLFEGMGRLQNHKTAKILKSDKALYEFVISMVPGDFVGKLRVLAAQVIFCS